MFYFKKKFLMKEINNNGNTENTKDEVKHSSQMIGFYF